MTQPLVSVLILTYNHERYLAAALDSIVAQELSGEIEVLIGDDFSSDGTRAIADSYASRHPGIVRVLATERNVGMHENHARLLEASRGEFVAYCDGDDFWTTPAKLEIEVAHLRQHPEQSGVHSDVDHLIVRGDRSYVMKSYWARHLPNKASTTTFDDLLRQNVVQTCTVLLRGDVARAFRGSPLDNARYAVGDWPVSLHATLSGPMGYIRSSLAVYRRVAGSSTNQGAKAAEIRIRDQLRMLTDAAALGGHDQAALREGLEQTRFALVVTGLRAGDTAMVRTWVRESRAASDDYGRVRRAHLLSLIPGGIPAAGAMWRARTLLSERLRYRARRSGDSHG